jgi:hypothetical protein
MYELTQHCQRFSTVAEVVMYASQVCRQLLHSRFVIIIFKVYMYHDENMLYLLYDFIKDYEP